MVTKVNKPVVKAVKSVKLAPNAGLTHSNVLKVKGGEYACVLVTQGHSVVELPKAKRVPFKNLLLLSLFVLNKALHQKVSSRGYVTLQTLKHVPASKDLVVTPVDGQIACAGVSEFVVAEPTPKAVQKTLKKLAKEEDKGIKQLRKVAGKVQKFSEKAKKAETKLQKLTTKKASTAGVTPTPV
jgi:hypothetical protein